MKTASIAIMRRMRIKFASEHFGKSTCLPPEEIEIVEDTSRSK